MEKFIEVTTISGCKRLINVSNISYVKVNNGVVEIILLSTRENGCSRSVTVTDTYLQVKDKILGIG